MDVKDSKVKEKLKNFGIPENKMTLQMAMYVSLIQQAVNGNIICNYIPRHGAVSLGHRIAHCNHQSNSPYFFGLYESFLRYKICLAISIKSFFILTFV